MGMHIWYRLHLPLPTTFDDAVSKIRQLREYALTVGFTGSEPLPPVGKIRMGTDADPQAEVHYVTEELGNGRERNTSVPARRWVRFSTMPGDGTESAVMGLACYPELYDTTRAKNRRKSRASRP